MTSVKQHCNSIKDDLEQLDPTSKLLTILEREVLYDSQEAAKSLIEIQEPT